MSASAKNRDNVPGGYAKNDFYVASTTTQDEYERIDFVNAQGDGFIAGGQIVVCDTANALDFSYDGVNLHGTLQEGESATFDHRTRQCIFVKPNSAGNNASYRIWAW